jgi:hypothetical protein
VSRPGFSRTIGLLEGLEDNDIAAIIDVDAYTRSAQMLYVTSLESPISADSCIDPYLSACDPAFIDSLYHFDPSSPYPSFASSPPPFLSTPLQNSVFYGTKAKKKYKPVAKKIRSVVGPVPEKFRVVRNIIGDPLAEMPPLDPNPPSEFVPTERYTLECKDITDKGHPEGFLWPRERDLLHDFMRKQDRGFAWNDSQRGRFRTDFFPPVEFPLVPHTPWIQKNIPIPPGLYDEVCALIRKKIDAGVYEPSNSSYRSRWFCVVKKGGKSLRIVHSLEPLNAVTIRHSGVTPVPDHVAEQFAGRSCGAMLDLYVGYDERPIAESSRDYTTFQTPYGAKRLVSLPMGWTNSVPIFHDDVTHILQPEVPHHTVPYIDDVPVKGPPTRYKTKDGSYETIPENPGIRRFVWEHFGILNRIVQRMKYCGGTFSGLKLTLCSPEIIVLGHRCTSEGRKPPEDLVQALTKWLRCDNVSEVRSFLGTVGVCRIFVKNFAHRAHHLVKLTRLDEPFEWGPLQDAARNDLVEAVLTSPALKPLDYTSESPVILAVDTSNIAVGYLLCQCDAENPRVRHYARFGSITLEPRESRFSQPKLELYGLHRALGELRLYLIGVRNLVVEVDATYIKGMLANPDIMPQASINRWIMAIQTFHFDLVHVPSTHHGPDGLSRRPRQPDDSDPPDLDDYEDWIDRLHSFVHQINFPVIPGSCPPVPPVSAMELVSTLSLDEPVVSSDDSYGIVPRSQPAKNEDIRVDLVRKWLSDFVRPHWLADGSYARFRRYCGEFFLDGDRLWRKDPNGAHKLVVSPARRLSVMSLVHEDLGHKGLHPTRSTICERFWWPHMLGDIAWFVRSCHMCQVRQTRQVLIPPVVATPAPLFAKVYIDTMHMPASGGYSYIVQGRCSLTTYPEFRVLRKESAKTLGDWIYEDLLCRWGSLREIVSDNGSVFLKALAYLAKRYHIRHIRISGYNSRANGIVERSHFDVRQSLYKAVDGDEKRWSNAAHSVFWAERITVRKRMGCSPYFAVTGSHPLIPLDISEATYLLPPPDSVLATTDHIARRALALQKRSADLARLHSDVYKARLRAAVAFEKKHEITIRDFKFRKGDLVLLRNTTVEKHLNRKMRPRYLGPLIVISRNFGGAYILCELDGSVLHRPVAAFRVIPYFARTSIPLPDGFIDIDTKRLREMEQTSASESEIDY